jgi:hypothetical protein
LQWKKRRDVFDMRRGGNDTRLRRRRGAWSKRRLNRLRAKKKRHGGCGVRRGRSEKQPKRPV